MRSLFWKIFLYFLLIIVLVAATVVVLTFFREQEFPPLAHQGFARRAIVEYGREAIAAFERAGSDELDEYIGRLQRDSGISLALFDRRGQPLSSRRMPRRMMHMAHRALRTGEIVFPMMGARNGMAATVQSSTGDVFVVAVSLPERPEPRDLLRGLARGIFGWQLLILLFITAGVCYVLARSLTSPISRLSEATRRFAGGDLSTRIGGRIRGGNELARLAGDFDEMAGKIEALVSSQRRLLRDISHELRSPLARLGIALELVRQQGDPKNQQKALERIALESERMNEMIGQLLSLTRLETGENRFRTERFDVAVMLADLVKDASFEAQNRNCRVEFSGPESLIFEGVEDLLSQAFENVIRNAVKYTANDSIVEVSLQKRDGGFKVKVADQGPGVPLEALPRLFDPFYRVDDDRDRKSGGTGIGLAIAERAVRLHKGKISVKNRREGGLSIEIDVPF